MKKTFTNIKTTAAAAALSFAALTPLSTQAMNIVETADSAGSFTTLVSVLESTGLDTALSAAGSFTVFAPTDEAFSMMDADELAWLVENPKYLKQTLLFHVVGDEVTSTELMAMLEGKKKLKVETLLSKEKLTVRSMADTKKAMKSNMLVVAGESTSLDSVDVDADNGVIHVINKVLVPTHIAKKMRMPAKKAGMIDIKITGEETEEMYNVSVTLDPSMKKKTVTKPMYVVYLMDESGEVLRKKETMKKKVMFKNLETDMMYDVRFKQKNMYGESKLSKKNQFEYSSLTDM